MEKVRLLGWTQIEDGMMGRFELSNGTPVNVCIDNYEDLSNKEQENYNIEIFGAGQFLEIYKNEEEYAAAEGNMAEESLIPTGTFPADGDFENFEEEPTILFAGKVTEVDFDPEADDDQPNVQMRIKTFGMDFTVYWYTDEKVEVGNIVYGGAWLFGEAHPETDGQ